jgi:hypothetical protein
MGYYNKNKYFLTVIGIFLFFLLLYFLNRIELYLEHWVTATFKGLHAYFYSTCANFVFHLLAVVSLGISKLVHVKGFDWKLFVLYLIIGVIISFANFIVGYLPPIFAPPNINLMMFLVKISPYGGFVVGIGFILSIRTKIEDV